MDRRVKFEAAADKSFREKVNSAPRMPRDGRAPDRKATVDRATAQPKTKQVMGFEDFLKRKPGKPGSKPEFERNQQLKPPVPKQRSRAEKPASQPVVDKPSNIKKVSQFKENPEYPPLEPGEKKEMSLENIFDSRMIADDDGQTMDYHKEQAASPEPARPALANRSVVDNRGNTYEALSVQNTAAGFPQDRPQHVGSSPNSPAKLGYEDSQLASKNIRGLFKKEIYGDDESKRREAQIRMKKELEMQMEEKKLKKDIEKRRKEEEEKIENEKYNKYLERERLKKEEEEKKELENKRKKELFNIQQAALLEEYKQTSHAEKRSRGGKKSAMTDATTSQGLTNQNNQSNTTNSLVPKGGLPHHDRTSIQSNLNTNNTVYGQQPNSTIGQQGSLENNRTNSDSNFGGGNLAMTASSP